MRVHARDPWISPQRDRCVPTTSWSTFTRPPWNVFQSMDITRGACLSATAILGCYDRRIMPRARSATPDALRFGRLLKNLRLQRGWNLQRFARESQMTATYLGLLERGLNLPSLTAVIT